MLTRGPRALAEKRFAFFFSLVPSRVRIRLLILTKKTTPLLAELFLELVDGLDRIAFCP